MNLRGLSFEAMPPLAVPFQFFIVAPLFIIAMGLFWLFASPVELASRWSSLILASTHTITIGFMMMVMFGALFQVLPVVTAVAIPGAKKLSIWVFGFLFIGVSCLISGFVFEHPGLLAVGAGLILIAFIIFLAGLLMAFPKMLNKPTSWAIRFATFGLLVTTGLGVAFVIAWLDPSLFPIFRLWTNTHLLWGFIGWTLLLVMGVSFQIIPMFYVTPDYPKWVSHFLPVAIILQLIIFSISRIMIPFGETSILIQAQLVLLTLCVSSYAIYTLFLIGKRKRKTLDITLWFWKTAMGSLIIAAAVFLVMLFQPGQYQAQLELIIGVLLLVGFAVSLITGMLLKVVPFLVWLNIQQKWIKHPSRKMPLSNMQQVIPVDVAKRQYFLFIPILPVTLIIFSGFNLIWLIKLASIMLLLAFSHLFYYLQQARRLYSKLDAQLDETQNIAEA